MVKNTLKARFRALRKKSRKRSLSKYKNRFVKRGRKVARGKGDLERVSCLIHGTSFEFFEKNVGVVFLFSFFRLYGV